jgi:hypothetical protein
MHRFEFEYIIVRILKLVEVLWVPGMTKTDWFLERVEISSKWIIFYTEETVATNNKDVES